MQFCVTLSIWNFCISKWKGWNLNNDFERELSVKTSFYFTLSRKFGDFRTIFGVVVNAST